MKRKRTLTTEEIIGLWDLTWVSCLLYAVLAWLLS